MPDSNGEEVYEMKGERVYNVDQAFEMGLSNNTHLIFANALIEKGLYDEASSLLIDAVFQDKEISQRWGEEEKAQQETIKEILKEILSSENAAWISQTTRKTSESRMTEPRLFMDKENFHESIKIKDILTSNLRELIGLESIRNDVTDSGDSVIPLYATGESYKTCFPKVNFTIFYNNEPPSTIYNGEKLKEGWYYTFNSN